MYFMPSVSVTTFERDMEYYSTFSADNEPSSFFCHSTQFVVPNDMR